LTAIFDSLPVPLRDDRVPTLLLGLGDSLGLDLTRHDSIRLGSATLTIGHLPAAFRLAVTGGLEGVAWKSEGAK
jgi:hypothetical protein